jgi:carbonic anhydrase
MQRNRLSAGVIFLSVSIPLTPFMASHAAPPAQSKKVTADDALKQLMEGNARFAKGDAIHPRRTPADFRAVSESQSPIAIVVACADSRVSPELLFDAGVGELFVIRVAGNVVDRAGVTVKGSIEYAIAELNAPLIVVLGHTNCGAVKAAVQHIDQKDSLPGAINGLVELIKPAVSKVQGQPGDVYDRVTRENVNAGVDKLKNLDPIIAPRVKTGGVKVVGGVYDLQTGTVKLLQPEAK